MHDRRPVILPDYSELEFRISEDARSPALVCLDGKVFTQLQIGDSGGCCSFGGVCMWWWSIEA